MQLPVQSAYANKALFFFRNKEALAVLCSVAKHSLELLEHSSCWGNVRRGRRTGFHFRLTGKARLVVKKKRGTGRYIPRNGRSLFKSFDGVTLLLCATQLYFDKACTLLANQNAISK